MDFVRGSNLGNLPWILSEGAILEVILKEQSKVQIL